MRVSSKLFEFLIVLSCTSLANADNLIVNGSFEFGSSPSTIVNLATGSTAIDGWTVTGDGIDYIRSFWQASDGIRSVDLDGSEGPPYPSGGVSQTIDTIAGANYFVTFDLAGNPDASAPLGTPAVKPMRVSAAGQSKDFYFDITGQSFANMGWEEITWLFEANSATTTIEFRSLLAPPNNGWGAALDNVSVEQLPATSGPFFYSVDTNSDELVVVNPSSGQVKVVGPLGKDVMGVSLTSVNGRLYGLESSFGDFVNLLELDRSTGAVISTTEVINPGSTINSGESLAHVGEQLKIGFSVGNDFHSESLGDLALDGTISNAVSFGTTPQGSLTDFDGLGTGEGDLLYTSDGFGPFGNSADDAIFFSLDVVTNERVEVARFNDSGVDNLDDLVSFERTLYAITSGSNVLRAIDLDTGALVEDIALNRLGSYEGLALAIFLSGDLDFDNDVDGTDFLTWQREDGTPRGLAIWQSNYGQESQATLATSEIVPEPRAFALLAMFFLFALWMKPGLSHF